jgi:hypothetical protein
MDSNEKLFLELIDGFVWKHDKNTFPNRLFAFKDDSCLFVIYNVVWFSPEKFIVCHRLGLKQELKDFYFYVNQEKIWNIFSRKFDGYYKTTKQFLQDMMENNFEVQEPNLRKCTRFNLKIFEEHFKLNNLK